MDPIRVLIADDHMLVRAGIRSLLEALEGVEVVAAAGDTTRRWRWPGTTAPTSSSRTSPCPASLASSSRPSWPAS